MTIGFDGSRAFIGERTGTENYSYQLLKALAKIDHKNHYLVYTRPVTQNSTAVERYVNWPANFIIRQIPWQRFWTQGGLAIQTFKDPLDVLFVPAHTLPVIRKPGLKTVVTVHDLGSEYLPSMHQLKQRLYLAFLQRYQLKGASKIIAVSKATKDDLVKRVGIDPENVTVVYEGYDKEVFRPVSARGRSSLGRNSLRQYGLKPGGYFLFVGTVQPRKNLERVIKAFSKVATRAVAKNRSTNQSRSFSNSLVSLEVRQLTSNFTIDSPHFLTDSHFVAPTLVIVGSKGWLSDEIYRLPKKLGIEGNVKFLGYVPNEDLPALYSSAQALVFPSLFEGFGLSILEAQACGCPVITSNVSSMPEVAGEGAILVDPYSVDDIVRGILRLRSGQVREKLIKRGFENIKRFSWEKCAGETLRVLEVLRA